MGQDRWNLPGGIDGAQPAQADDGLPFAVGRACASALASVWPSRSRWMNRPPVICPVLSVAMAIRALRTGDSRSKPDRARCTGWHDPCRDTGARRLGTPVSFPGLSSSWRLRVFPWRLIFIIHPADRTRGQHSGAICLERRRSPRSACAPFRPVRHAPCDCSGRR